MISRMKRLVIVVVTAVVAACAPTQKNEDAEVEASALYGVMLYAEGDYTAALERVRPWAEQGNTSGMLMISVMYLDGKGVPRDGVLAYMWASLGAAHATGSKRLEALELRDEIARGMTPEQIARAEWLARQWKPGKKTD